VSWLYTSGTTGTAKAAMHQHGSVPVVCETYGHQVLGIGPEDRCLSAAKAFLAIMLNSGLPRDALPGVRLAASAGEALPSALQQRWTSHFGVRILDRLGMTEMLHILLSNRPGQIRLGTTGVAVPDYDPLRLRARKSRRPG
jgi:acyl-coenzyme A synthetase/AMP-(fatty) acid ligase